MSRIAVVLTAIALLAIVASVAKGATSPAPLNSAGALSTVPKVAVLPTEGPPPVPIATPTAQPTATATPTPAPQPTNTPTQSAGLNAGAAKYKAVVDQYLDGLPGTFGVVVHDMKTGDTYVLNADRPFPTASLYKLGLMYTVFKLDRQGKISLQTKMDITQADMSESEFDEKLVPGMTVSIDRSLWFLITLSSNSAAIALNHYVSWADVNQAMQQLGLVNTRMPGDRTYGDWRDEMPSSTPNEIYRFFEMVYKKQLVDEDASDEMMYLLRHQQVDDRLSVNLPDGVVMAHKTGNLSGVINDVGIIFGPKTDLYVGVMTQGADYEQTTKALQGLGLALYKAANQ